MPVKTKAGLSGNALKLLALAAMTCDHVGLQLLPDVLSLRILGRLALPIFAYMVAEGCRHTRSMKHYFLRLACLALGCQVVYFFAMGSLYQCILVTFSLSIALILGVQRWQGEGRVWPFAAILAGASFLCLGMPRYLPGFAIDYGLLGVLLPVAAYLPKKFPQRILASAVMLALLGLELGGLQWWAMGALPLLALYNGQKGRGNIGRLFYWYYPAHLVVIYGLSLILL